MSTPRRSSRAAALIVATLLLGALLPQAASAQSRCITTLPVGVTLPGGYFAVGYTKDIRVQVTTRGVRVRNVRADLYTFSGRRMGGTKTRPAVRGTATLPLTLLPVFRPMQIGGFTLVVTGEPNASRSCGPKKAIRVVKFRGCKTTLPILFPNTPGGFAGDYEGYLSVPVRSRGPLIRDLTSSIYGFDGSLLGKSNGLAALFGETTLDHALLRPLTPGRYTVIVEGLLDEQPATCGRKRAQTTLTFR